MGGHSIFVLEPGDKNARVVFETLTDDGERFAIVQKYLPDIVTGGDSRVLLIDGEPVPYALARIPSGRGQPRQSRRRRQGRRPRRSTSATAGCARQIGPALREAGMLFVGLDVIGGYVTEINVTSPTGVRELERQFDLDIGAHAHRRDRRGGCTSDARASARAAILPP